MCSRHSLYSNHSDCPDNAFSLFSPFGTNNKPLLWMGEGRFFYSGQSRFNKQLAFNGEFVQCTH